MAGSNDISTATAIIGNSPSIRPRAAGLIVRIGLIKGKTPANFEREAIEATKATVG